MRHIKEMVFANKDKPMQLVNSVTEIVIEGFFTLCVVVTIIGIVSWICGQL